MHNLLLELAAAAYGVCGAAVLFAKDVTLTTSVANPGAAETVMVVAANLTVEQNTGKASVKGLLLLSPGATTTAVTLRIYRGTTAAGTLISTATAQAGNFAAGSPTQFTVQAVDILVNVGTAQYCMTLQQTGASGNGAVASAVIETEILSG